MMTHRFRTTLAAVALAALPLAAAQAQEPVDQRTYFTFSETVELPGVTLEAGTYQFRLLDPMTFGNRHVVQVLNEDGSRMLATLHAIPNQRREPAESPEVRFLETPEGQPSAVATWWYPGRSVGQEFIWPRDRAEALARSSNRAVLTTGSDTVWGDGLPADAELARVTPTGETERVTADANPQSADVIGRAESGRVDTDRETQRTAQAEAADRDRTMTQQQTEARAAQQQQATQAPPATQPRTTTEPQIAQREPQTPQADQQRRTLPRTAGVLPLVAFIGIASLAAAAGVRRLRRRH